MVGVTLSCCMLDFRGEIFFIYNIYIYIHIPSQSLGKTRVEIILAPKCQNPQRFGLFHHFSALETNDLSLAGKK